MRPKEGRSRAKRKTTPDAQASPSTLPLGGCSLTGSPLFPAKSILAFLPLAVCCPLKVPVSVSVSGKEHQSPYGCQRPLK